jgi:hypothetical protein
MVVVMKPKAYVSLIKIIIIIIIIKIEGNRKLIMVILNFILLRNQNDGWTVL